MNGKNFIYPWKNEDHYQITVKELIETLKQLPPDLKVGYDSGVCHIVKDEIHYNDTEVILND